MDNPAYPAADIVTATLIGTFGDGKTITQSYSFQNNNVLTTNDFASIALAGFNDLASFAIVASGVPSQGLSVDNIVIGEAAAVPEPGVLAIFGLAWRALLLRDSASLRGSVDDVPFLFGAVTVTC